MESRSDFYCNDTPAPYKCKICNFSTHIRVDLITHVHSIPSLYSCRFCKFYSWSFLMLTKHLTSKHRGEDLEAAYTVYSYQKIGRAGPPVNRRIKKYYGCVKCLQKAKYVINVLEQRDGTYSHWYKCEECWMTTGTKVDLARGSFVRRPHISSDSQTRYKCNFCSYSTRFPYRFKRHLVSVEHLGKKVPADSFKKLINCKYCNYKAVSEEYLSKHLHSLHSDKLRKEMANEQSSDSDECWFKCEKCTFRTKWSSNLKIHELICNSK